MVVAWTGKEAVDTLEDAQILAIFGYFADRADKMCR